MKIIKLDEAQFNKLFETSPAETGNFDNGIPTNASNKEVGIAPQQITDADGNDSSKDVKNNKIPKRFGDFQSNQHFGAMTGKGGLYTV